MLHEQSVFNWLFLSATDDFQQSQKTSAQTTWVTCADTIVPRTGFFYMRFVPRNKIEPVFGTFNIKRTVRFGTV
jgi:hypothetical protein